MLSGDRSLLFGVCAITLSLAACGSGSYSSTSGSLSAVSGTATTTNGTASPITFSSGTALSGTKDSVVATSSVAGSVSVAVGATRPVSIAFNSSDGRLISGFGVTNTLGALPAGWSGPGSFSCASVTTGSSCVLNLTYTPAAVGTGTLTVNYEYLDDSTQPQTGGAIVVAYAGTPNDNVVAAASPSGQITATLGRGAQAVAIDFTTDDGNAATGFMVTSDLTALPTGWSAAAGSPSCAIVSTGNGCQLMLTYAPVTAGSGMLTLSYAYQDDSGAAKTGAMNIAYASTSANSVVGGASPTSQIVAVQKSAGQPVALTFDTDDGRAAADLFVTSDLTALPAGWSSASSTFSCGTLSTGNGCQLRLTYAPTALTNGTLTLNYAYEDGSGAERTGLLNLGYAATTNDNVKNTPSPAGQIAAVLSDGNQAGNGSQAVSVTFATDDGRPATALRVTSDLTLLPAGWSSSAGAFTCAGLNVDTLCQLGLTYAPTLPGSGVLTLNYGYENNANEARTGTVSIPYRATTNDNVSGLPTPNPLPSLQIGSGTTTVAVAFTTDDGNPASLLAVTTGLALLPTDWTGPAAFACASISAGSDCVLTLAYTPTVAASGAVTLGFSYVNDAGIAGTGNVTIGYSATP